MVSFHKMMACRLVSDVSLKRCEGHFQFVALKVPTAADQSLFMREDLAGSCESVVQCFFG